MGKDTLLNVLKHRSLVLVNGRLSDSEFTELGNNVDSVICDTIKKSNLKWDNFI